MTNEIILQAITTQELEELLRSLVRAEFQAMNTELQRVIGEDDLVSTGTACRILGVSNKVLKILLDQGYFTIYYHLKERRYNRGELLAYRNKYRVNRMRE
ncbi:hypothetical protein [Lewinella sp. LCG006]|uniref:hypothetical protein n=1 Tax=Lewinella sp. LCG006 TaxID=3231911 RepID=UPI00345F4950